MDGCNAMRIGWHFLSRESDACKQETTRHSSSVKQRRSNSEGWGVTPPREPVDLNRVDSLTCSQ